MKIRFWIIGIFTGVLFNACASAPFEKVDFRPVSHLDTNMVCENFKKMIPDTFEVMESAVNIYKGHEITCLSYTHVSEKEELIEVLGFSPLGMKLMQVQASGTGMEYSFNIPQVEKRVDKHILAEAIAEDIRRIYFERVPPLNVDVSKGKDRIFFEQKKGDGRIEWVFGGPGNRLYKKHYFEGKREVWSVRYFEYKVKGAYIYPCKIYLEDHDHKRQLVLRLKEVLE